jgi:hypothetical protein
MAGVDGEPVEGFQWTNNFNWYSGVTSQVLGNFSIFNYAANGCSGFDINYINCWATQGIGNTLYNMGHNVISGGYTDTSVPSGQATTSTMSTAFTGLTNTYLATGTVAGTITAIKWSNPQIDNILFNYNLAYNSPYIAGSNPYGIASSIGVDMDKLNAEQGLVTLNGSTAVTSSGATISYYAPDSQVCNVLVSSMNNISTTAPTADAGGARARSVALTGLASHTNYYYWATCPGNAMMSQKTGSFRTH